MQKKRLIIKLEARDPQVDGTPLVTPPLLLGLLMSEGFSLGHYEILCGLKVFYFR